MSSRARAFVVLGAVALSTACSLIVGLEEREVAAPVEPPRCDPNKPFGAPVYLAEVSTTAIEEGAWPSPSNRELYVARREPNNDLLLHRYTRAAVGDIWVHDRVFYELMVGTAADGGSPYATSNMAFTPDGLTAYLAVYEGALGTWGIYVTHRSSVDGAWSRPVPARGLEAVENDQAPFLSASGRRIYFQSNRGSAANFRIWAADVADGGFAQPGSIGSITAEEDRFPVVMPDELTLYFGTYKSLGEAGTPQMYVHRATRKSTSAPFTEPKWDETLNVESFYTAPVALSRDGCEMYLVADRPGYSFGDVWVARRPL